MIIIITIKLFEIEYFWTVPKTAGIYYVTWSFERNKFLITVSTVCTAIEENKLYMKWKLMFIKLKKSLPLFKLIGI